MLSALLTPISMPSMIKSKTHFKKRCSKLISLQIYLTAVAAHCSLMAAVLQRAVVCAKITKDTLKKPAFPQAVKPGILLFFLLNNALWMTVAVQLGSTTNAGKMAGPNKMELHAILN
jgi:hypothetical protein